MDALRDDGADALDRLQIVNARVAKCVEHRANVRVLRQADGEPPREIVGGRVADVTDPEREKDP